MRAVCGMRPLRAVRRVCIMSRMSAAAVGGMRAVSRVCSVGRMSSMRGKSFLSKQHAKNDHHAAYCKDFAAGDIPFFIKEKILHRMLYMWEEFFEIHHQVSFMLKQVPFSHFVSNVFPASL